MLCPEIVNFPLPKVITSSSTNVKLKNITDTINMNSFYESMVLAIPDESDLPKPLADILLEDTDYYKINECSLTEFINPKFIKNFIQNGSCYCLTANRNCMTENCASISPAGILTLHINKPLFQTLGIEGVKRPHNFVEVNINLKEEKLTERLRQAVNRLEKFDFYISWYPSENRVCPSSIAKYFTDKQYSVELKSIKSDICSHRIKVFPTLDKADVEDVFEWIGMLVFNGDMEPNEPYISTYVQPDGIEQQVNKILIVIIRGFLTSKIVSEACDTLDDYMGVIKRNDNIWASITLQSNENSLWQWSPSTPKMFQSQNNTHNILFSSLNNVIYSIGQLKYT